MECRIEYTTSYTHMELVHDALYRFNVKCTGQDFDPAVKAKKVDRSEALILYAAENNEFLGGIVWHWLDDSQNIFVDYMFVSELLRGQGWGSRLFTEFEKIVKSRGAIEVAVTTNSFQAPDFYLKIGYELTGENAKPQPLVPDNIHYHYCKKL